MNKNLAEFLLLMGMLATVYVVWFMGLSSDTERIVLLLIVVLELATYLVYRFTAKPNQNKGQEPLEEETPFLTEKDPESKEEGTEGEESPKQEMEQDENK